MSRPFTDLGRAGDLISDDDVVKLMEALARGQGSFSEDEAERLVKWAHLQRTGAAVVDMLISGSASVSMREGAEPLIHRAKKPGEA